MPYPICMVFHIRSSVRSHFGPVPGCFTAPGCSSCRPAGHVGGHGPAAVHARGIQPFDQLAGHFGAPGLGRPAPGLAGAVQGSAASTGASCSSSTSDCSSTGGCSSAYSSDGDTTGGSSSSSSSICWRSCDSPDHPPGSREGLGGSHRHPVSPHPGVPVHQEPARAPRTHSLPLVPEQPAEPDHDHRRVSPAGGSDPDFDQQPDFQQPNRCDQLLPVECVYMYMYMYIAWFWFSRGYHCEGWPMPFAWCWFSRG